MADKKASGYDLEGARKAEISDEDSLQHLAKLHNYDLVGARDAGISDQESLSHLATLPAPAAEVYEKESPEFFGGLGASAGAAAAAGDIVFSKGRQLFRTGEKLFGLEDPNAPKVKPRQFATPSQVAERAIGLRTDLPSGSTGAVENYGRSQFVSPEGKGLYYGAGETGDYSGARKAAERAIETERMYPGMKVLPGQTPIALPQDVTAQVETQRAEQQRLQDIENQKQVNRVAELRAQRLEERRRLQDVSNRNKMFTGSQTVATKAGAPIIGGYQLGAQGAQAYNRLSRDDLQASDIASGATNIGGSALAASSLMPGGKFRLPKALGSTALNYLSDVLDVRDPRREKSVLEEKAQGGLVYLAEGGGKLGKAVGAAKKVASKFKPTDEQTVTDPVRNAFPGIYKRPDVIAQEAAARVAPESPALKQLFGVTRDDLFEMGKGRVGNMPGVLPGMAANPKGSAAATNIMNPRNEQRLLDVLGEAEKYPELVKGMDPWYIMDPVYKRMEELMGPEKAKAAFQRFNTLTGMASPGSDVLTEMNRGTAANYLAQQNRFGDFLKYAGKPASARGADFPEDLRSVMGHPYHMTAQGTPMKKYLESGEIQMKSPKVPAYIQASSVPEVGFQTNLPVGDAHWSRAVGLADTRGGQSFGASVSNPEMAQLAPWWREKIAGQVGIESVPAQARAWGAFSPQTGVESPIGAPKIELLSMKIMEAAKRLGISPEQARDMILKGEAYAGKKEGGSIDAYAKGKIVRAGRDLILPPAENAARTQIIGTLPTYAKAAEILKQRGATGRGIDVGAGLGEGSKLLGKNFDTMEPYAKNWKPTYTSAEEMPSDAYGQLTNLNVLNVMPREARDELVENIGRTMEPGGLGILTTRGADVMKAQGRPGPEDMSIITSRDTYQKGFTKQELEDYLRYMLGEKFDVNKLNLGPAGAVIQKKAEGGSTTPAWQRSEGKNPEGGLNAKGRASYNRETGGNLKAPQPEGGSRKKSFCARMGGMKKKLTSSKTANDPDSRINKALRKWKC